MLQDFCFPSSFMASKQLDIKMRFIFSLKHFAKDSEKIDIKELNEG